MPQWGIRRSRKRPERVMRNEQSDRSKEALRRLSMRKTNRNCNQSFSVRKSYHGKGYVLRRRPQSEQGRFWDIRIPKTAADFRLWERRVEKQPAAHLIRGFPGSVRENIRMSSSGNNQPEPEESCRAAWGWAGTYLTSGPAAAGYGAAGTLAALRARRALPPCGRHEPAGRQSGTRGLFGEYPKAPEGSGFWRGLRGRGGRNRSRALKLRG